MSLRSNWPNILNLIQAVVKLIKLTSKDSMPMSLLNFAANISTFVQLEAGAEISASAKRGDTVAAQQHNILNLIQAAVGAQPLLTCNFSL